MVSSPECVLKKQGDNEKIGEPEYQVYPNSSIGCELDSDFTVFLQIFKEDLYPASTSRSRSLQRLPEPALSGIQDIKDMETIQQELDLSAGPHFTTLQKFFSRIKTFTSG
jgi:hypothetical protein